MDRLTLPSPPGTREAFAVAIEGSTLRIDGRAYPLPAADHAAWLDLYARLATDLDLPMPLARQAHVLPQGDPALRPLLTHNLSPSIRYGYGDPSVTRIKAPNGSQSWRLLVTSNDAPDAFPLLRSDDLEIWTHTGFVFPRGKTPAWTLVGEGRADFWAPEMHKVGEEYWVVFTARGWDHGLGIGLARADNPDGPFVGDEAPLITGGVIDPHILMVEGAPHLVWKVDTNDLWPRLLADLLHRSPTLLADIFPRPADRRAATLVATLWPWTRGLEPMEQFFVNQPLIEAVTTDFAAVRIALGKVGRAAEPILEAMRTRIHAQPLSRDGRALMGRATVLLENDQPWEAHLIEGAWIAQYGGRSVIVYAGNDFSTPRYGVGAAVADHPLGPYRKLPAPLLGSTRDWWGPGHPSVTLDAGGKPRLFLHAFRPGEAGYKVFRALLTAELAFDGDRVRLAAPSNDVPLTRL